MKRTSTNLLADEALLASTESTTPPATLQAEAHAMLGYVETLADVGDDLMFTMDVPYVPIQDTAIVLAQAATTGAGPSPQPDFILNDCKDTESTGDPMSAMRGVDPAGLLKIYIQDQVHHYVDIADIKNVTLLEGTAHGDLNAKISGSGRTYFMYDPKPGYVGKDKAVFMVDFKSKHYKIVVELRVFLMVDEKAPSTCQPPQLFKVKGKPITDSSPYLPNSLTVTFGNLGGDAIGETSAAGMTLGVGAAVNRWYIDSTSAGQRRHNKASRSSPFAMH